MTAGILPWTYKKAKDYPGSIASLIMHLALMLLMAYGLPDIFKKQKPLENTISVQIVSEIPIQATKEPEPTAKIDEPKPDIEPVEKPEVIKNVTPKIETKPVPVVPSPAPIEPSPPKPIKEESPLAPPPPKPSVKPNEEIVRDDKKKPKEKKEKKDFEEVKEEKKTKDDDFSNVLKSVEEFKKQETKPTTKQVEAKEGQEVKEVSQGEINNIIQQISTCWSMPAGAKDSENLIVNFKVWLTPDGTVRRVQPTDNARLSNNSYLRSASESAERAIIDCSPLRGLPQEKYDSWKELELKFDPKEMIF